MSCSARKFEERTRRPAYLLYDGPAFQLLRKYLAGRGYGAPGSSYPTGSLAAPDLTVMIVSAKYGPVPLGNMIEWYDKKLTMGEAIIEKNLGRWSLALNRHCRIYNPTDGFFHGGIAYKSAVPVTSWQTPGLHVTLSAGGQGQQLSQLKTWLEKGGTID
jgi:hypothetical protein